MRALALLALLLAAGCVSLGEDARLTALAYESWAAVGGPEAPVGAFEGHRVLGGPAVVRFGALPYRVCVPWPWSEWDAAARVIMRYELSKVAWIANAPVGLGWLAWLDAHLHAPPSELHSWWRVCFPREGAE